MAKVKPFARHGHFVQIDNAIFDVVIPKISASACKILMIILRFTEGWNKEDEYISYSELVEKSGVKSRSTVANCIEELSDYGVIITEKSNNFITATRYILNTEFEVEDGKLSSPKIRRGVVQNLDQGSLKNEPQVVQNLDHSIKGSIKTVKDTLLKTEERQTAPIEDQNLLNQDKLPNIESPLAVELKKVCKKTLILSPNDRGKMQQALMILEAENATVAQMQEFGRKVKLHWIGRDTKTKQPRAPGILQVAENWRDVLDIDENVVEIITGGQNANIPRMPTRVAHDDASLRRYAAKKQAEAQAL